MTYPAEVLPGQRATADRMNAGFAIGRLVFFAARDAAQSVTTGGTSGDASNALSWDNIILDELGGWSAAQPTRYTPPIAGWYLCTGAAAFTGSTSGTYRGVSWLVNGSVVVAATAKPIASAPANTTLTVEARALPVELDGDDDYVQLAPFHNVGSNLDTTGSSLRPFAAIYYAGPS